MLCTIDLHINMHFFFYIPEISLQCKKEFNINRSCTKGSKDLVKYLNLIINNTYNII